MKRILNTIRDFLIAIGEAKYAANLAYNGKIKEAQDIYRD